MPLVIGLNAEEEVEQRVFEDYSQSHQRRLKRKRAADCELSLNWLHLEGFTPSKLEILNNTTEEVETIHLAADILGPDVYSATQEDFELINMVLLIKDKHSTIPFYHEMASVCKKMPKHYKLKQRVKELNTLWNIILTPNGTLGVQQSFEDRLIIQLSRLLAISPEDALFKQKKTPRVKLSGDGTHIGKRLHVTNFTFTILDEGPIAHTSEGNHILAIVKVPEKCELLKLALEDVCHDVERLNEIKIEIRKIYVASNIFLGAI